MHLPQELKERVLTAMEDAFAELRADVRPQKQEISHMLDLLWQRGPRAGKQGDSLKQLVQLTRLLHAPPTPEPLLHTAFPAHDSHVTQDLI